MNPQLGVLTACCIVGSSYARNPILEETDEVEYNMLRGLKKTEEEDSEGEGLFYFFRCVAGKPVDTSTGFDSCEL